MPVVVIDELTYFILIVILAVLALLLPIIYFGITRRMMGQLGKAEFRNKKGHIAIIEAPDGSVSIERARLHYSGILVSIAKTPRFGKYFFTGKGTTLRPVDAPRISFIEARSSVAGSAGLAALTEVLRGSHDAYQPRNQRPGVPRADNIETLLIWWAENKYYPSLSYRPKVRALSKDEQHRLEVESAAMYQQWRADYIADQLEAIHFEVQRLNELSMLHEIKTGTLRKISRLQSHEVDPETLVVKPSITTEVAKQPLSDTERHEWFIKMTNLAASWPESWPAEVGGREVDIREIFGWNLTTFSQGDVSQLDAVTRELVLSGQRRDTIKIVLYAMAFLFIMVGIVVLFRGIGIV